MAWRGRPRVGLGQKDISQNSKNGTEGPPGLDIGPVEVLMPIVRVSNVHTHNDSVPDPLDLIIIEATFLVGEPTVAYLHPTFFYCVV